MCQRTFAVFPSGSQSACHQRDACDRLSETHLTKTRGKLSQEWEFCDEEEVKSNVLKERPRTYIVR